MFSLSPPWQYLPHSVVQRCTKVSRCERWAQVGREEALGPYLETGSAFCQEVEITGRYQCSIRGARLPRQISAQKIVFEITDVSPCGKRTISQARCALHLSEIQGPASGLEHQWTSRGDAGPAGVERSSFRVPLSTHTSTHHPQGLGHLPFTPGDPLFPAAWDHPRTPSVLDKPGWLVTRLFTPIY